MEASIIALISSLTSTISSDTSLNTVISIIILTGLYIIYRYILRPIKIKVDASSTEIEVNKLINSDIEKSKCLEDVIVKLNTIISVISETKTFTKDNSKEIQDMKRDIEDIKSIINQFQGHLLYGNRRSSDFDNKELI